jgi:hypothetical protein
MFYQLQLEQGVLRTASVERSTSVEGEKRDPRFPSDVEKAPVCKSEKSAYKMFPNRSTLQSRVYGVLQDRRWHCRKHEYQDLPSSQLAGGGGIQGLQNGTKSRKGLEIKSEQRFCATCAQITRHDRWTGEHQRSTAASTISQKNTDTILKYYEYTDAIEQRTRPAHELVIDHRLPKIRWGQNEPPLPKDLSDEEVYRRFQLLKKDESGNHNLLKSRACEMCLKTGKRGTPLNISHYYKGDENWPDGVPMEGPNAEKGCEGCGWYNFAKWREDLNTRLSIMPPALAQ